MMGAIEERGGGTVWEMEQWRGCGVLLVAVKLNNVALGSRMAAARRCKMPVKVRRSWTRLGVFGQVENVGLFL